MASLAPAAHSATQTVKGRCGTTSASGVTLGLALLGTGATLWLIAADTNGLAVLAALPVAACLLLAWCSAGKLAQLRQRPLCLIAGAALLSVYFEGAWQPLAQALLLSIVVSFSWLALKRLAGSPWLMLAYGAFMLTCFLVTATAIPWLYLPASFLLCAWYLRLQLEREEAMSNSFC